MLEIDIKIRANDKFAIMDALEDICEDIDNEQSEIEIISETYSYEYGVKKA